MLPAELSFTVTDCLLILYDLVIFAEDTENNYVRVKQRNAMAWYWHILG